MLYIGPAIIIVSIYQIVFNKEVHTRLKVTTVLLVVDEVRFSYFRNRNLNMLCKLKMIGRWLSDGSHHFLVYATRIEASSFSSFKRLWLARLKVKLSLLPFSMSFNATAVAAHATQLSSQSLYANIDLTQLSWLEQMWAAWYIWIDNPIIATGLMSFLLHEVSCLLLLLRRFH